MEGQAEAEAEALNHNPEDIRGRQPKLKQSLDESKKQPEAEAEALNKPKMIRCRQPKQKRQLESPNESEQQTEASSNKPEKRGRKPKLTEGERHANKIESGRLYRQNKAAKKKALQEKNQELDEENKRLEEENKELKNEKDEENKRLEEENKELKNEKEAQQSEIKSLKEELSKISARADNLEREVSDESKKVNIVRMVNKALEPGMQQLEQNFLNQDDQDYHLEFYDIPMDDEWLNDLENLKDFTKHQNLQWCKTIGSFGEGTSIAKAKLSPLRETMNVNGFGALKDNFTMIQEIFSNASGLRFRHPASRNGFMNTLAEVYEMATTELEKRTPDEIKRMEEGIEDLELAGLEISWLKNLVVECGKRFKRRKKLEA